MNLRIVMSDWPVPERLSDGARRNSTRENHVMTGSSLIPAAELVKKAGFRYPNDSREYRQARNALLIEEIELRRQIERVAELRRALPDGGEVTRDYDFIGEKGPVNFAGLFGDKQTLV